MDTNAAIALIQRASDDFRTGMGKARAEQALSEELIASVEYELEQLKKLVAEHKLAS
jgi:DNA topoisomerase IB